MGILIAETGYFRLLRKAIFCFPLAFLVFTACQQNKFDVDTSHINLEINISRFEQDLFECDLENMETAVQNLKSKYGDFFTIYCENIVKIGHPDDPGFYIYLRD